MIDLNMLKQLITKGKTKMRNKIKDLHNKLLKYKAYGEACVVCRAGSRVARMTAPAGVGAYLVYKYDDKLIIGIGVAGMLYSLVVATVTAYKAEKAK